MMSLFADPILRAPLVGSMLMCFACALVGVIVFVRKEALLGESLAHATYPGIMIGSLWVATQGLTSYLIWGLVGAALFCGLSLLMLQWVKKNLKFSSDTSLCFTLTLFFGVGLTLSSYLQTYNSMAYKQARIFLFGQAATITDASLTLYFGLCIAIVIALLLFYRAIQVVNLDPVFSSTLGISNKTILTLCYSLIIIAVVVGIRSIGLFLLSGMLIGPAVAARQWTNRLDKMFVLSGMFGLLSGFLGVVISNFVSRLSHLNYSLATGPTILLVSASFSIFSLIFAPQRGWLIRYLRILKFRFQCNRENILKSLWLIEQKESQGALSEHIFVHQSLNHIHFNLLVQCLKIEGFMTQKGQVLHLSAKGKVKAERIVRMHRLWEVYLVHIGVEKDHVHHNAEEMEHIITPQIEQELVKMMDHPSKDPHDQPIPSGGLLC